MRTLILLAVIVSAYGAEPRSNRVIIEEVEGSRPVLDAAATLNAAEAAYVDALVAVAESWDIHPLPLPDVGNDPRQSEQENIRVISDYNDLSGNMLPLLRRYRDKNQRDNGWRHSIMSVLVSIKVRQEKAIASGLISRLHATTAAAKPKSQITATLPDGTVIKSNSRP